MNVVTNNYKKLSPFMVTKHYLLLLPALHFLITSSKDYFRKVKASELASSELGNPTLPFQRPSVNSFRHKVNQLSEKIVLHIK